MNNPFKVLLLLALGIYLPVHVAGQEKSVQPYTIFHAVPADQMREMTTDRPDVTESPFTVDAGHVQYETDLIRNVRERSEQAETNTWLINQFSFKIGLLPSTAIEFGFETYGKQAEKSLVSGTRQTSRGTGDLTLRVKQNLLGNDGDGLGLALLPYCKFPTSQYDSESMFEGGLIVPVHYTLRGEWDLGMQLEVDRLKDQDQQALHTEWLQSLTVAHALFKKLDGIAETYYTYDFKAHQWTNYLNAALQVEVFKDVKLDAGLNYGIQKTAEKHYFLGASCRF